MFTISCEPRDPCDIALRKSQSRDIFLQDSISRNWHLYSKDQLNCVHNQYSLLLYAYCQCIRQMTFQMYHVSAVSYTDPHATADSHNKWSFRATNEGPYSQKIEHINIYFKNFKRFYNVCRYMILQRSLQIQTIIWWFNYSPNKKPNLSSDIWNIWKLQGTRKFLRKL